MGKVKEWFQGFLVSVGVFLIGALAGMGGLVLWFARRERRAAKTRKEIEDELRKKSPDDIVDSLDNADAVRAIITGHGVGCPDDNPAPGDATLHNPSVWGTDNIFHGRRVDRIKPPTVGGSD